MWVGDNDEQHGAYPPAYSLFKKLGESHSDLELANNFSAFLKKNFFFFFLVTRHLREKKYIYICMYIRTHTHYCFGVLGKWGYLHFLSKTSLVGSSKCGDSPPKSNCKNSTSCFFKLVLYVVNHVCSLLWQTQVFTVARAGGKCFGAVRASLRTVSRVICKVCATNAALQCKWCWGWKALVPQWKRLFTCRESRLVFFFPWNFLWEGNTWTPSCIFVKLFFKVQQLNDHRLKSWGVAFLTCEPCHALRFRTWPKGRRRVAVLAPIWHLIRCSALSGVRDSVDFDLPFLS